MEEEYKKEKKDEIFYYAKIYILAGILVSFLIYMAAQAYVIAIKGFYPKF